MSVNIPSTFGFTIDLDLVAPVDVNLKLPTDYSFGLTKLPKIDIGIDPLTFTLNPVEIKPLDFSIRLKEIPSVRMHLPLDYRVGLSVLGAELVCVRLCGQGQVITQPYVANPCEC